MRSIDLVLPSAGGKTHPIRLDKITGFQLSGLSDIILTIERDGRTDQDFREVFLTSGIWYPVEIQAGNLVFYLTAATGAAGKLTVSTSPTTGSNKTCHQ